MCLRIKFCNHHLPGRIHFIQYRTARYKEGIKFNNNSSTIRLHVIYCIYSTFRQHLIPYFCYISYIVRLLLILDELTLKSVLYSLQWCMVHGTHSRANFTQWSHSGTNTASAWMCPTIYSTLPSMGILLSPPTRNNVVENHCMKHLQTKQLLLKFFKT